MRVGHGGRRVGAGHRAAACAKPGERMRAGDFMDEVAVDDDQAGAVGALFEDMRVPDFLIKGAGPSYAGSLTPGDRRRGVEGKSVSVRVDCGGRRSIHTKTTHSPGEAQRDYL